MPKAKRRVLARYDFEDRSAVEIACFGNVETATAIRIAENLIGMKREEIGKRAPVPIKAAG